MQRAMIRSLIVARNPSPEAQTIGQIVGRNLAQLREKQKQTQQEAAVFLRTEGLAWTAANIASIESGRRETIDVGTLTVLAYAYRVPLSRLFEGEGYMRLAAEVTVHLGSYRAWLDGTDLEGRQGLVRTNPLILELTGLAARKHIEAMPADSRFSFRADAELADRLGLEPKDVYQAAERLWDGRTLHEERDRRLAELGEMTPNQRRTRRGHITRQLAKELEPHLPSPTTRPRQPKEET